MKPLGRGHIVGTTECRSHLAIVNVNYNANDFSIITRRARTALRRRQHPRYYNKWVKNLEQRIRMKLIAASAVKALRAWRGGNSA